MRAVNLLPRDFEQERKAPPLPVVIGCAGAVLATAVLAGGYLSASSKVGHENHQLAAVNAQIAALPQPPTPPATISALPQERSARVSALASALSTRVAWDRLLREVSLILPGDVWLESLKATAPQPAAPGATTPAAGAATPTGFQLIGYTYSQPAVARLLARLSVIPELQDVTLNSSADSEVNNAPVISFTISGNVRAPGAAS